MPDIKDFESVVQWTETNGTWVAYDKETHDYFGIVTQKTMFGGMYKGKFSVAWQEGCKSVSTGYRFDTLEEAKVAVLVGRNLYLAQVQKPR